MSDAPIFIDDTAGLVAHRNSGPVRGGCNGNTAWALIVVDYLQLMQVPGNTENRATEISEISRSLKALAKELDVADHRRCRSSTVVWSNARTSVQ